MTARAEVLQASDQDIDDAVLYSDPMTLRGLLYQLTGDEDVAATRIVPAPAGFVPAKALADMAEVGLLQAKAAAFLKSYRDQGAPEVWIAQDRLQRSVGLVAGEDIPDRHMPMWVEEMALEPWARGLDWPAPPEPQTVQGFSVLVIGAGMNGLNAAIQLKRAGIPYTVVEKNSDVGGTWLENTYPGARVDTPSNGYCHLFGAEFERPYPFCPQSDNQRYNNWVADNFDVRGDIVFDTEVKTIIWDEDARGWEVQAVGPDGPRTWRVRAVITAVGFLSRPNVPTFEGEADFRGQMFHTARWPEGLDVAGKRVAVVGSGCSGYQAFAEIAKTAAHISLFQRTPSWVYETLGYLHPFPPQCTWLERNFPYYRNFLRLRAQWLFGPECLGRAFSRDPKINNEIRDQRLEFMRMKFADRPDLMDKMVPDHPPMASRPVLVDADYSVYDVLLKDNASLVTDGIARLTEKGIIDGKGHEHAVDIILLATGFHANKFLWPMDVQGRDGSRFEQLWEKDGARAYLGTLLPGFPNFFTLYGPNVNPIAGPGVPAIQEQQTRFILACIAQLILENKSTIDVGVDAYLQYNEELDEAESQRMYAGGEAKNYYTNEFGRSAANCPFDARKMWEWLRDPTGEYVKNAPGVSMNSDSKVRPYFGEDLIIE